MSFPPKVDEQKARAEDKKNTGNSKVTPDDEKTDGRSDSKPAEQKKAADQKNDDGKTTGRTTKAEKSVAESLRTVANDIDGELFMMGQRNFGAHEVAAREQVARAFRALADDLEA
jgi:hypothetical protein